MNQNKFVVANRANSTLIKVAVTMMIALSFALACTSTTAYAKKRHSKKGQIEITTSGNFEYRIEPDNVRGHTDSSRVTIVALDPGPHKLVIVLPSDKLWERDFEIERGRKLCVSVNYHPKKITVKPPPSPCPYPVIISAVEKVNDGDLIMFSAEVGYPGSRQLNYNWSVTAGTISGGQGTNSIRVDSTGLGGQTIVAKVVVDDGSGDAACRVSDQRPVYVIPRKPPEVKCREFDNFQSVAFDDDKARFDNLAIELQNAPDSQAVIIIYSGRHSRVGQADMLGKRTSDYLTSARQVDSGRFVIVDGGYRETDYFDIWICPPGAPRPEASPTVQPGDVQPKYERTRPRRPRRRADD
jgi:hypothetical protein